jgi:homogentisate 1,2-dioxygenase
MTRTDELAVMCDTFRPLRLSHLSKKLDDGKYALSWYENADAPAGSNGGSPTGVTSHV